MEVAREKKEEVKNMSLLTELHALLPFSGIDPAEKENTAGSQTPAEHSFCLELKLNLNGLQI